MKSTLHFLGISILAFAGAAMAQSGTSGCSARDPEAPRAYLVLDQSARSDSFRAALKSLTRPESVAVNTLKGDYSRMGPNAERHPLAYIYDGAGPVRQYEDPSEFARAVNSLTPCPRS